MADDAAKTTGTLHASQTDKPASYGGRVKEGMGKTEFNERHGHVLGLKDIDISMSAGCVQVVMGLSGSSRRSWSRP